MDAFHVIKCIPMVNTYIKLVCFLVKNLFLTVKQTLLLFPEFSSIGAVILHEIPAWTQNFPVFYSPTLRNDREKYFFPVEVLVVDHKIFVGNMKFHFDTEKVFFSGHF
jgi:hypothetical protein